MFTRPSSTLALAALLLAGHATAKTDLAGCVSSETVAYGGASLIWYVPDSGEICAFLDCGGGRAPPKTTVPGCPSYDGTATYSPSFLPGFGDATTSAVPAATESLSASASASEEFSGTDLTSLATITSPPVTTTTSSAAVVTETETQTQGDSASSSSAAGSSAPGSSAAGSSSDGAASGSSSQTSKSAGASTTRTSTAGAAIPTAAVKGAFGVMAGLAAGVAMM